MTIRLKSYTTNDSPNAQVVTLLGMVELYFSYETLVAFRTPWHGFICSENTWSRTTGKHLNVISRDHADRVSSEVFEVLVDDLERRLLLCFKHIDKLDLLERLESAAESSERRGSNE
jgi:hypothetical protein